MKTELRTRHTGDPVFCLHIDGFAATQAGFNTDRNVFRAGRCRYTYYFYVYKSAFSHAKRRFALDGGLYG